MSAITPSTNVKLLKCPLEIDNQNQLTFSNATAQYNYFNSLPKLEVENFTYQRKDGVIRWAAKIDDLWEYNYVMYQNEGFGNKWFYAYIEKMEFVNPNTTDIYIKTDVFQTWQFNLTYKQTFIEREHVNDDTIGLHTVPEGLECGEYEVVDMRNIPMYDDDDPTTENFIICFQVTKMPYASAPWFSSSSYQIGGVFNGVYYFAVSTMTAAHNIIEIYEDRGYTTSDAIINIYMIPRGSADTSTYAIWTKTDGSSSTYIYELNNNGWTSDVKTLEQPTVMAESYVPTNKKLYTYPFSYFYIDNNAGMNVEYKWEDFPNGNTTLGTYAPIVNYMKGLIPSPSISGKLFFTNYKTHQSTGAIDRLYHYGVPFARVPVCAWTTDYYTNWLTQNGLNIAISGGAAIAAGAVAGTAAALSGGTMLIAGAALTAIGSANTIGSLISETIKASKTPDQAEGDTNLGDFSFAYKKGAMSFLAMSVRKEYAQIIDNYFNMFGYKVSSEKLPNITGRRNWNFVKTVACYIEASIPQDDLQEIKTMFDTGITFWHSPTTFRDYSQNNDII